MARLGFALAGAVIGAFFGPIGAQIGFTVGGLVGSMLFPGKLPSGPRLNDLIVSTATNGAPIPFGYGIQRVAGNVIWAPPIVETTTTTSAKGGPKQTNYVYTASFAAAFCEGPAQIGRIWFDSKVVFDSRAVKQPNGTYQFTAPITGSAVIAGTTIQVTSTLNPPVGTQVIISGAAQGNGNFQVTASSPTQFSYFNPKGVAPGSSGTAALPPIKYPAPVIYFGNESQTADPTIQAAVGAANCSAFRGLCYAVWTNFPLNDFGNRIPNIRAEIQYQTTVIKSGNQSTIDARQAAVQQGPSSFFTSTTVAATANQSDIAILEAIGNANGNQRFGAAPDGTWTALSINSAFMKKVPAGALSVTQTFASCDASVQALLLLASAGGTPVFTGRGSGSGGTAITSLTFTPAPGNSLMCMIFYTSDSTSAGNPSGHAAATISDTANPSSAWSTVFDSYAKFFNPNLLWDQAGCLIFYLENATNAPTTITVNFTNGDGGQWAFYEISNVAKVSVPSSTPPLSAIVQDICQRTGLLATDIDTTQLDIGVGSPAVPTPAPLGYTISRPTTGQNALKPLTEAFFFDAVESGGVIRFVPRGKNTITSITIPEIDLGLVKDNFKLSEQLQMAQELPREVQVLFQDKNLDYQQNKTQKRRATRIVKTKNQTVFELAMVLDPSVARQISEKAMFLAYLERHPYDFNLWRPLYMLFDPTDVIQFTFEGLTFIARILKSDIGVDFSCALSLVSEDAATYQSTVQGSSGTGVVPATAKTVPDTVLFLFDVPLLQDTDSNPGGTGKYFAMGSLDPTHWPGASLQKSSDNVNFAQENTSVKAVHYGTATSVLPPPPTRGALGGASPWVWDTKSTLNIVMANGTLAGTSDINVLNGLNALLVGSAANGWELIQYANAVQNPDGSFTISRLLRGRRGTEGAAATHGLNETVIDVIANGVVRQPNATADLQVLRYYDGVTSGNSIDPTQSQTLTLKGLDTFPYAVTSVAGLRDQSGNLTVTWIRRTRIGGDWLEGIGTVPVSENTESYDIDILTGPNGTVVRTFSALASPTLSYSAAQQTTDFGGPISAISMNIYQNSGTIGRGFVKSVTV